MDQCTERLLQTSQHSSISSPAPSTPDPSDVFYVDDTVALVQSNNIAPPAAHFLPGGYRTRHLSCIMEQWSESESYTSLPIEPTNQSIPTENHADILRSESRSWEAEDVDEYITTLDESCLLNIESLERIDRIGSASEELSKTSSWPQKTTSNQNIVVEVEHHVHPDARASPLRNCHGGGGEVVHRYPNIMTTSCYGSLSGDPYENAYDDDDYREPAATALPETDVLEQLTQMLRNTEELVTRQQLQLQQEQQQQQQQPQHNDNYDYLILNPPLYLNNQPKCRSPLPISLNSSFCETSLNNSFHERASSMQTSIDFGKCGTPSITQPSTVNPLDMSFASQDDSNVESLELMVDNGEYIFRKRM